MALIFQTFWDKILMHFFVFQLRFHWNLFLIDIIHSGNGLAPVNKPLPEPLMTKSMPYDITRSWGVKCAAIIWEVLHGPCHLTREKEFNMLDSSIDLRPPTSLVLSSSPHGSLGNNQGCQIITGWAYLRNRFTRLRQFLQVSGLANRPNFKHCSNDQDCTLVIHCIWEWHFDDLVLTHWRYCSLALSHRLMMVDMCMKLTV